MKIERPCNLDVPTGATPMTIADDIGEDRQIHYAREIYNYRFYLCVRRKLLRWKLRSTESKCLSKIL